MGLRTREVRGRVRGKRLERRRLGFAAVGLDTGGLPKQISAVSWIKSHRKASVEPFDISAQPSREEGVASVMYQQ